MNGSSSESKTRDMDGQLAGLGYKVRSSELCQVAENMERLENAINTVNSSRDISQVVSDALLYDPSNIGLGSWVDTLLSELDQTVSLPYDLSSDLPDLPTDPNRQLGMHAGPAGSREHLLRHRKGCRLLHRRLAPPNLVSAKRCVHNLPYENDVLYHHYYEACPYLKFAHFTANQAILEAFSGHDCVHVIDFNLMQGLQWPALIQALALRPGGPPSLRLTGVGPPSPDERDTLREIGARLAELAHSVNVRFTFRGVAAWRLEDVKPWMLQVSPKEAVAVNSIMQLHRVLGSGIDAVLGWIRSLNPKIVTVVEQEANHNGEGFLERFTEALHYYSTVFDSLEACSVEPDKGLAEMYLQREICNVVCCEGPARVERHEPLAKWRERLAKAGLRPLHLGSNAYKQASMLLTLFSAEGYCVEENQGCLTLGWHSRPLIAASAWQAAPLREGETVRFQR
ncbi:hypothetical protein ACSQ67_025089 [Phaseolus vulgaris]